MNKSALCTFWAIELQEKNKKSLKNNYFYAIMKIQGEIMRKTSFGQINSIDISEQKVPLVVQKCTSDKFAYVGFIPALKVQSIYSDNIDECTAKLKDILTKKIKSMILNNEPFPFFPNQNEILEEYGSVERITFVKLTSKK